MEVAVRHHGVSMRGQYAKKARFRAVLKKLKDLWRRRHHPHVRDLNDHGLHDIGIRGADRERLRYRHPSQHSHHPRG